MALLLKNGAVFLHIPKTGGNFITTVLRDLGIVEKESFNKHYDYDHLYLPPSVQAHGRKKFGKYALKQFFSPFPKLEKLPFTFCFVRNPISWYESWYKYMSQESRRWKNWGDTSDMSQWHPNSPLNGLGDDDFNTMIKNIISNRPGYVTEMYGWYTKNVDFIGKQENLVDDLVKVLSIMNIEFDEEYIRSYERIGVSPKKKINWDEKLKEKVVYTELSALIRYNYQDTLKKYGLDFQL